MRRHSVLAWSLAGAAVALVGAVAVFSALGTGSDTAAWLVILAGAAVLAPAAVGTLVALRRPENPIGWLLLTDALVLGLCFLSDVYAEYAVLGHPGSLPSARWAVVASDSQWPLFFAAPVAIALVFPDGRFLSPRWRGIAIAIAAVFALMIVAEVFSSDPFTSPFEDVARPLPALPEAIAAPLLLVALPGMLFSLVAAFRALQLRYRSGTGVERLQVLWLAYAGALIPLTFVFCVALDAVAGEIDDLVMLPVCSIHIGMSAAVGVAVLRHRLYDIDRVINRTVVYAALTALLVAAWAATALLLGVAVGRGSAWATAGATLVAAVAFRPARARIQDLVDRRFDRRRYEAVQRVEDFLRDLRADRAAPEEVRGALAGALADPELEVAYWLPESGIHAAASGREIEPLPSAGRVVTPVARGGVPLGTVVHDAQLMARPKLLESVLQAAGLAIEIARLRVEVRRQLAEVQASRTRIVAAGYEERRRIERDLHDGAQQRLVSVGLALRHIQHDLGPSANGAGTALDGAVAEVGAAIDDLRELARGVRPARLDEGLAAALRDLAGRSPVAVRLDATGERFEPELEAAAYFVASEAITNAVKHAGATHVDVCAGRDGDRLVVSVADDGRGGAVAAPGSGLSGLGDRVAAHGGRLRVSSPAGEGTIVAAELPCAS